MAARMTRHGARSSTSSGAAVGIRLLAIAMCLGACAGQRGAGASQPEEFEFADAKKDILVGPEAFEGGVMVLAAWLAYGFAKRAAYQDHRPPPANDSADDFTLELAARSAQAAFWAERQKEGAPDHADFDRQLEIWRAGFLPELVIALHGRPGWTVPPEALSKLRFETFVTKFEGRYGKGAPVVVKSQSGKAFPDVPGADFPDPAKLPKGAASCALLLDERKAAWSRFAALEPRLGGVPVSAESPLGFAHQLSVARDEPTHRARGVTWVSERVGHLAEVEGFCAVERKDWPEAVRALTKSVSLRPDYAGERLELALALTAVNRPDEALAQVNQALRMTKNGCIAGMAWRRRGYILIEMGALDAAEAAYKTSQKYDPKNPIALKELEHIAQVRRERGPGKAEPKATSVDTSVAGLSVTVCQSDKEQ